MHEELNHNRANAVTGGIWRVRRGQGTAIRKVLRAHDPDAQAHWQASDDPRHWNYWCREALVYTSGLPGRLGLGAPALLDAIVEEDRAELLLEDVEGRHGAALGRDDLISVARVVGRAQSMRPVDTPAWLSRGFLRAYSSSKPADWDLLDDDEAWSQPLIRDHWPATLRPQLVRLHAERDWFLSTVEQLPRSICHLDLWPNNVIVRPDGEVVLIDWAFVGDGALGEDIGNLVPDAVFDQLQPSSEIDALDAGVFAAYLDGLRQAGWTGDERHVRLAMCASAIKYEWLAPMLLRRAIDGDHFAYGGGAVDSIAAQYHDRGVGFGLLARWADEARAIAATL